MKAVRSDAGALGLLAVAGACRQGGEDVAIEARHPHQLEAGERLGARAGTEGLYDVVVEAAGTADSLARSIELRTLRPCANRGRVTRRSR